MAKRGIRNNNPGNLIISNIPWKGKIPRNKNTDGKYEQFTSPHYGIRAMVMDIKNDIVKDKLNTIRKLINEYAPKHENPTKAYIDFVAKHTGISPDTPIDINKDLFGITKAIIHFENGESPYTTTQILMAINDAYSQ